MMAKEQIDRIVEAIDSVASELSDNSEIRLSTDDYNLVSYLGEQLESIANTLKKIEAKMK